MARKAKIEHAKKIAKLIEKHRPKRTKLNEIIKSSTDPDEIMNAQIERAKLPVNSNPVRLNKICTQCSRSRGVYRKFALCRICLRQQLMNGNVTGGRKSSW